MFVVDDESVVDESPVESEVLEIEDARFFVVAVIDGGIGASNGGTHCCTVELEVVEVSEGEDVGCHKSVYDFDEEVAREIWWEVGGV